MISAGYLRSRRALLQRKLSTKTKKLGTATREDVKALLGEVEELQGKIRATNQLLATLGAANQKPVGKREPM